MSRRYREPVEVVTDVVPPDVVPPDVVPPEVVPTGFTWRGGRYTVLTVLGHWREDAGWWAGGGVEIPQRDLWRVEALGGGLSAPPGVYELVCQDGAWRLDRVWD